MTINLLVFVPAVKADSLVVDPPADPGAIIVLPDTPVDPIITPIPGEANKDGLGESVAGLEVINIPSPEESAVPTSSSQPSTAPKIKVSRGAGTVTQASPVVLGEAGAVDSVVTQAKPLPESVKSEIVANEVAPKIARSNSHMWVIVGVAGALIIAVMIGWYRLTRSPIKVSEK